MVKRVTGWLSGLEDFFYKPQSLSTCGQFADLEVDRNHDEALIVSHNFVSLNSFPESRLNGTNCLSST